MKILIIRNIPTYMEIQNNSYNIQEIGLAKALVRRGEECDVLFWTSEEEKEMIIPVYVYPEEQEQRKEVGMVHVYYRHGKSILKNAVFTRCYDLFSSYDVLQPCEYNQMQSWILSGKYPHKTIIYHGPYYSSFNTRYNLMCRVFDAFFLKRYEKKGTRFMAKSRLAEDFLVQKGIAKKNVACVGVGMDTQMLSRDSKVPKCDTGLEKAGTQGKVFDAMKQNQDGVKVLYIGRVEERRNIPFLIDCFNELRKKIPSAMLYMIGTGDREYLESAFSYMKETGAEDHIIWQEKAEQKDLSMIYRMADFFLLPTKYEIFGMVLLEAMYYGNVVLTTNGGGASQLIENGENGFILSAEDPKTWAECMCNVLAHTDRKEAIRKKAHETIRDQYTWDDRAPLFIEQYRSLLDES